ncbi:MAG: glycosyltransferase [Patescibacteria group bacterium]|nr:glycosyltransferase [Patescibacteria group bacterium]
MKISIVVPYYQAPASIHQLIDALNKQGIPQDLRNEFEVIIVNDECGKILPIVIPQTTFPLRVVVSQHKGVAGARNIGIKNARGELIFFLDQDCIPTPSWLASLYSSFVRNEDVSGIGGRIVPKKGGGVVNDYFNITNRLGHPIIDSQTGAIVTLITGNAGFRINALMKIGYFDEKDFDVNSHGGEDVDITYRLKRAGMRIYYEPNAIVSHMYPNHIKDIFYKYANYGMGMRIFCEKHQIDPQSIRQPGFSLSSKIIYFLTFYLQTKKYLQTFRGITLWRRLLFVLLDFLRYFGHGYGYYKKNNRKRVITTG